MRSLSVAFLLAGLCVAAAADQGRGRGGGAETQIKPGEECPPGTTESRPGRCTAPTMPAPSILDYRPKSTLVTKETLVPTKFAVVDIHNHTTITAGNIDEMITAMDALNLRVLVNLSGGSGEELKRNVEFIRSSAPQDRFRVFANVNWNGAGGAGWAEREVAGLRQAVKDGAIGRRQAAICGHLRCAGGGQGQGPIRGIPLTREEGREAAAKPRSSFLSSR